MTSETEHIQYALPAQHYTTMYLMHKYWARKPGNVVAEYIKRYSRDGEVVLDPFAGSGVTAIEALKLNRKAIAIDLNPISTLVTRMTALPVDLKSLDIAYNKVRNLVKNKIDKLYKVACSACKATTYATYFVWSYVVKCPLCGKNVNMYYSKRPSGKSQNIYLCTNCKQKFSYGNAEIIDEKPMKYYYICHKCGHKGKDRAAPVQKFKSLTEFWYPKIKFYYPNGKPFMTKRRASTIEEFFSKRNLYALSMLFDVIDKLKEKNEKDLLKFVYSSMIP